MQYRRLRISMKHAVRDGITAGSQTDSAFRRPKLQRDSSRSGAERRSLVPRHAQANACRGLRSRCLRVIHEPTVDIRGRCEAVRRQCSDVEGRLEAAELPLPRIDWQVSQHTRDQCGIEVARDMLHIR